MRILFIGDIFGKPGRTAVQHLLPLLREELQPALVIANAENATHGTGMNEHAFQELSAAGIDVFTGGNHTLARPEILDLMAAHPNVVCPGNVSSLVHDHGWTVVRTTEAPVAVINIMGQYCLNSGDNPFRYAEEILAVPAIAQTPVRILDFHAEATAEKAAMLHLLNGKVSAILGTHTHVPTADARVTTAGTAFITDVGMTGVQSSIIGLDSDVMLQRFTTGILYPSHVAEGDPTLTAVVVDVDPTSGCGTAIQLLQRVS